MIGTAEELTAVVDIVLREGMPRGLILSTANTVEAPARPKSSVWSPMAILGEQDQDPLQRGLVRVRSGDGITVLGAPVGWRGYVREIVEQRIQKIRKTTELLPPLRNPHCEFVLLRSCLALPKIMFLLRALDMSDHVDLLETFDSITRGALCRILGSAVSDLQWLQARHPVAMGGLGLRAADDHAPVAYASSLLASKRLVDGLLGKADEEVIANIPQPVLDRIALKQGDETSAESLVGVSQKASSLKVDLFNQSILLNQVQEEGQDRETARMLSLGLPRAGDWLTAVPMPALGLHLRPAEFVPCLKYRLGVPVYSADGTCPSCSGPSDKMGDHALGCRKHNERIARHDQLRDVLYEAASSAALAPIREAPHLLPGSVARPGDLLIRRWVDGKDGAIDVTVTGPLAQSNVASASAAAGGALEKAFKRKVEGAAQACQEQGISFLPVAVETLGGFHKVAVEQTKRIGAALSRHQGIEENIAIKQLFQRMALTLMRGNAALIVSRRPDSDLAQPEVDGIQ